MWDMISEDLLTVEQAAARLQLHQDTIRRLLRNGQLPGVKVGKRQWRISSSVLQRYVEGDSRKPSANAEVGIKS
jgi:excisionase family DNA binding protein